MGRPAFTHSLSLRWTFQPSPDVGSGKELGPTQVSKQAQDGEEEDQPGQCGSSEVETSQLRIFFTEAHKVPAEVEEHHPGGDEMVFSGELSPPEAEQAVSTGERRAEVLQRKAVPQVPSFLPSSGLGFFWVEKAVEMRVGVLLTTESRGGGRFCQGGRVWPWLGEPSWVSVHPT